MNDDGDDGDFMPEWPEPMTCLRCYAFPNRFDELFVNPRDENRRQFCRDCYFAVWGHAALDKFSMASKGVER